MKYTQLTKEQFEALHTEFSTFLATNGIDKPEWDNLKAKNDSKVDEFLNLFSDIIWERVLTQTNFLEHFSKNHIFLFQCFDTHVKSIVLKSLNPEVDFLTKTGLEWFSDNLFTDTIEIKIGQKKFTDERNFSLFSLIQQGAILSNGELYQKINTIIESKV